MSTPERIDPGPPSPLFEVTDLTYRYHEATALDGLSLSIERGQRIAILGANGSGKSTLLRILDALYFADSGSAFFCGHPLTEESLQNEKFFFEFRRQVSLVFQNPDVQLFNPTVFDELAFGPLQLKLPKSEIKRCVNDTLEMMDISHLRDRSPHRLSGGEKKRVALASVLILDPAVLLMDEPTATLDPGSQSQVIDMLVGWSGGTKTTISTTHDLGIVEDIADFCFVFQSGRMVAKGTPREILGDIELLQRTNLVHAHRHKHESGEIHSHPHLHSGHTHHE